MYIYPIYLARASQTFNPASRYRAITVEKSYLIAANLSPAPKFPFASVDLIPLVYNSRISPDLPSDAELLTRIWPETAPPGSLLRLSILLSTWGPRSPPPSASPLRDVSNLTRCSSTTASNHSDSPSPSLSLSPSPLFRVARVRCREAATPQRRLVGPRASPLFAFVRELN